MTVREREDAVVAQLHQLAPHLDGEPDPAFRSATRDRLVAMAAVRTPAPEPTSRLKRLLAARADDSPPSRWRARLTAGLAGAALTVTAAAALVAVAADARPGDVLYGLKRGTEQSQLALAGDSRGETLLDFARTRLDELESLVDDGPTALPAAGAPGPGDATVLAAGSDPALVISTLETMDDQTTEGTAWLTDRAVTTEDARPLADLAVWVATQSDGLASLEPLLPDAAEDAAGRSLALLSGIAARAEGLRSAVACPEGPAVNGSDELGPVPGLCLPPVPASPGPGGGGTSPGTGVPGTGPAPQATTPTLPPVPPGGTGAGGTGSGSGPGELPTTVPTVPPAPSLPSPGGIPSLPSLPLPGSNASPPVLHVPLGVPLSVCLPPLATVGDC